MNIFRDVMCAGALLHVGACMAAVERLDDTASPRSQISPTWVSRLPSSSLANDDFAQHDPLVTVKFGRVEYRLATARFVGRQARIYYVIPKLIVGLRSTSGLTVEWRGGTVFANGSGRPGDRVMVWSGLIRDKSIADALELNMHLDLNELRVQRGTQFGFESYFEIEFL